MCRYPDFPSGRRDPESCNRAPLAVEHPVRRIDPFLSQGPESLGGENTNGWFQPSVNSSLKNNGVQPDVDASPNNDSSTVSTGPVMTFAGR